MYNDIFHSSDTAAGEKPVITLLFVLEIKINQGYSASPCQTIAVDVGLC
jgi:hypothetical protein